MKFSIQSRRDDQSNELMELAKSYLTDFGLQFDEEEPEIVFRLVAMGHYCMRSIVIRIVWIK